MNGLADVLTKVPARIRVRFANVGFRGEIDHVLDAMLANDLLNQCTVFDIAFVKGTEFGGPAMPGAEIVQNDRLAPGSGQQFTSMTSDVTGAAGYQYGTCQGTSTYRLFYVTVC